jgi:hypothetical protein
MASPGVLGVKPREGAGPSPGRPSTRGVSVLDRRRQSETGAISLTGLVFGPK